MLNKALLTFIIVFTNQILFSQNKETLRFENTIKPEISNSIVNYLFSQNEVNTHQLDSIKLAERELLKSKIIGLWKYEFSICPDCVKGKVRHKNMMKYILITDDYIIFYQKKVRSKNITRKEKVLFTDNFEYNTGVTDLVFEDKSIWCIQTNESNNYLKIYKSGYEIENTRSTYISGISANYYKRIE